MTALEDCRVRNGATRLSPGSHCRPRLRQPEEHEIADAEMPAGSTVIYLGSTIHGAGRNSTRSEWRPGLHVSYALGWPHTEENNYLAVPPEAARTLPRAAQEVLGYAVHDAIASAGGYLGMVALRDPVELLCAPRRGIRLRRAPTKRSPLPMGHIFLSRDWFAEVDKITAEISPPVPAVIKDLVINFRIKGGPQGDVEARMQGGRLLQGFGPSAPATVNVPFDVARKMMVENDQNAAMQAFMSGQIAVEGDMAQLMAMQAAGPPSPESQQVAERVRAMTA